jgi:rRNA pseudouridine-1189 N-methylase Emg1 (Nep1/Mra1 family)
LKHCGESETRKGKLSLYIHPKEIILERIIWEENITGCPRNAIAMFQISTQLMIENSIQKNNFVTEIIKIAVTEPML